MGMQVCMCVPVCKYVWVDVSTYNMFVNLSIAGTTCLPWAICLFVTNDRVGKVRREPR